MKKETYKLLLEIAVKECEHLRNVNALFKEESERDHAYLGEIAARFDGVLFARNCDGLLNRISHAIELAKQVAGLQRDELKARQELQAANAEIARLKALMIEFLPQEPPENARKKSQGPGKNGKVEDDGDDGA
jgi:rubrerythrin